MQLVQRFLMCVCAAALVTAPAGAATPSPERLRKFSADAMVLNQGTLAKLEAIEVKLGEVPLSRVLTPTIMLAPGGIEACKAALAHMRTLLAQRREVMRAHQEQGRRLITPDLAALIGPSDVARIKSAGDAAQARQDRLDAARTQMADAIDAVIAWAVSQGRSITVEKGQLVLDNAEQAKQYKALLARIHSAADAEAVAMQAIEQKRPEAQERLDAQKKLHATP